MSKSIRSTRARFAARAAACIGLGVLTTVVVALAFAAWPAPAIKSWSTKEGSRKLSSSEAYGSLSARRLRWYGMTGYGAFARAGPIYHDPQIANADAPESIPPPWLRAGLLPWGNGGVPWPKTETTEYRHIRVCGWPLGALSCSAGMTLPSSALALERSATYSPTDIKGWELPPSLAGWFPNTAFWGHAFFPSHPIWPGLLADTAFYGVLWAAALFGPGRVRRWIRIRRGHCALCGYDKKGLANAAPCPECGGGVQPAA